MLILGLEGLENKRWCLSGSTNRSFTREVCQGHIAPRHPLLVAVDVIHQTRERVFHQDIQTLRSGSKKRGSAEFCF